MARSRTYRHDLCLSPLWFQLDAQGRPLPGQADLPLWRLPLSFHPRGQSPLLPSVGQGPGPGNVRRGFQHRRHRPGSGGTAGDGLFLGQKKPVGPRV